MTKRMSKPEERARRVLLAVASMSPGVDKLRDLQGELEELRDSLLEQTYQLLIGKRGPAMQIIMVKTEKVEVAMQIIEGMVDACDNVSTMVGEIDFRW
ncbi:hypothetical protein CMI37_25710 [Candidatus Pacearchaeota archaeon]|nr:hypothetical protein [Candidatus Pacearchaeota archaeon]|tara:strand:+ start:1231 stop:1524 length:294 start_codon:yes stop_codon:yes gene_type:complete